MSTFFLKFQGFYESSHSTEIDSYIENEEDYFLNEHENCEAIKNYLEENNFEFWEVVDYKETYKNYSKMFLEAFKDDLNKEYNMGLELEFIALDSPKFYNYSTDKIEFKTNFNEAKVREIIYNNEDLQGCLEREIDEVTTSKSGYIPFYTFGQIMFENKDNTLISCFFDSLVEGFEMDGYFLEPLHENICNSIVFKKDFENFLK